MTDLHVVVHADAEAFLARARPWLMENEDEHNLLLGLASRLCGTPPSRGPERYWFATVEDRSRVWGCAFRTPPYKVGVTRMPLEAADAVALAVMERYPEIPAVFGPRDVAVAVAEVWVSRKGGVAHEGLPQRMYRLDRVTWPVGVPGGMRLARPDEQDTVDAWGEGFARDIGPAFSTTRETRQQWVAEGGLWFWEDQGAPVSMALATGHTEHGVRIGYVYTPPDRRGRGYASALVAALSQRALDEGARFCVLYTDLTNPTSNAIYPRVGYRALCDLVDVDLVLPPGDP